MEQSRIDFQRNQTSGKIINSIDHDYTKLHQPKSFKVDHNYKIHLFGYE